MRIIRTNSQLLSAIEDQQRIENDYHEGDFDIDSLSEPTDEQLQDIERRAA